MDKSEWLGLSAIIAVILFFLALFGWGLWDNTRQLWATNECRAIGYTRGFYSQGRNYCIQERVSPLERPEHLERP